MAIRYDTNLNNEIRRTVANFNKKVRRLEKQEREILPEKVSVEDLKSSFTNRRELLRELKKLQSFSEKGMEDIVTTKGDFIGTKYDYLNYKRDKARSLRAVGRQIKIEEKTASPLKITRNSHLGLLKHRKEILSRSLDEATGNELLSLINMIREQEKRFKSDKIFYDNYFTMLFKDAELIGYPPEKIKAIENSLRRLTPEQLYSLEENDGAVRSIVDYYPTKNKKGASNASSLEAAFDSLYQRSEMIANMFK